jgi:hypothetical protein
MAEQLLKGLLPLPPEAPQKKKAPTYTLVMNESGAMKRVPTSTLAPRTAITSLAVAPPKAIDSPAKEVEEELGFEEEEEKEKPPAPVLEELVLNEPDKAPPAPKAKSVRNPRNPKKAPNWSTIDPSEKIKVFYTYRAKYPTFFGYTAEGNLEVKPNNPYGIPAGTITLRAFSGLTMEELEELEQAQKEEQADVEEKYVQKMKELRTFYSAYKAAPSDPSLAKEVVKLNEQMRELSVLRNKALYPERWISDVSNPEVRRILLAQTHEERKLGSDAYVFKRFSLSREDAEGRYRDHGAGEGLGQEGGGTVVLFLTDPENPTTGVFHPATEREFVFNKTRYASPYQAYQVEQFKALGDEPLVEKLLGTRSAKTIRQLISGYPKPVPPSPSLWEEIYEALLTQHKDLGDRVKATGSARFHMMDKLIGDPSVANALVSVRTKLKEHDDQAPTGGDEVDQSVITKDEQQKAKVGAIIRNVRRG